LTKGGFIGAFFLFIRVVRVIRGSLGS